MKWLLQGKKRKGLVLLYGKDWAYSVLNRENTGGIPERSKGSDCKSDGYAFEGSNPSPTTMICGTEFLWCRKALRERYAGMVQW